MLNNYLISQYNYMDWKSAMYVIDGRQISPQQRVVFKV